MMQKINIPIICFLVAMLPLFTHAQVNSTGIQQQFDYYRKTTLSEKVYIHTDKNFYLAGEILWWKLYYVDGIFHQPLDISKIAYVEVLDKTSKPVMQAKIAIQNGSGNGSFYLPVSLTSGNYTLRAYTNWMKNFGADYFFEKNITIVNSLKPLNLATTNPPTAYDVQFFPEGGNIVRDIQSKVAFRVTDQYGKGQNFTGALVDDNNDTVLNFKPLSFGMGQFLFTSAGNHSYKAILKLDNGQIITKSFPAAYEKGYVMQLAEENGGNIKIKVTTNIQNAPGVFLFAHTREVIKVAANASFVNGVAEFSFAGKELGDGISHLTIFDINQQPVCERLYFKKPSRNLSIEVGSDAQQYVTRKKVELSVHTPIPANMSLSVYRLDSLQTADESTIQSYLWLTSDLKGTIESPGYYFDNNNDVHEATDNLMLTHGWRRFNWDSVLRYPYSYNYAPEYDGHIVTGRVFNTANNQPASEIKTNLSVPGVQVLYYSALSDTNGNVHFDVRDYYGQGEMVVFADGGKGTNFRVDITNPFFEQYTRQLQPLTLNESVQRTLSNSSIGMQVQNAYNSEKLSRFDVPVTDTLPFFGTHGVRYLLDDYVRFVTMEEVLREYVFEIGIRRVGGEPHLLVSDFPNKGFYSGEPLILLDGIPVTHEAILAYDPLKVRKLEVVPSRYIRGQFIYDGVISFTTYDGTKEGLKMDPHAVSMDYSGLQVKREFYSPAYETEAAIGNRIPDFRNVLYWSPDIHTNNAGSTRITFYTSDMKGKYIGVLQGIDSTGNAGSKTFSFEVGNTK